MAILQIPFSAPMVRALLDGRKTQTRRMLKRQPRGEPRFESGNIEDHFPNDTFDAWPSPYAPGDLLYVREAAYFAPNRVAYAATNEALANGERVEGFGRLRPSIHMPRWASRLTLAVTDVRVQRLNEISERDAMAEGVPRHPVNAESWTVPGYHPNSFPMTAPTAFSLLWDSIHGPGSWDLNPWIVAVTFTVHKVNVDEFQVTTAGAAA